MPPKYKRSIEFIKNKFLVDELLSLFYLTKGFPLKLRGHCSTIIVQGGHRAVQVKKHAA